MNSASEIFGNPFQGFPHISSSVSLFCRQLALYLNVLRVQIDLHFTKVQEILFKNFCSLAPVAIAVRSEERVTDIVCVALQGSVRLLSHS
ncbi:hypothetical protein QP500_10225, partial [Pauljensenia sp. UMB0018B]|nr:hypothetical protein [Pauljensenia sp. UMB0018B]